MEQMLLNGSDWTLTGWWKNQWMMATSMETDTAIPACIQPIPATVPGAVQLDLMKAGLLDDPFIGADSLKGEWVNLREWTLCKTFRVPASFRGKRCVLHFEGLDFCGHIQLNNQKIREFSGMFEPVDIDVTDLLCYDGENLLRVLFHFSPEVDGQYGFTSKMTEIKSRFNYVWDWCPRIVPVGIWDDVCLYCYEHCDILDFYPKAVPTAENAGRIDAQLSLSCRTQGSYTVRCTLQDNGHSIAALEKSFELSEGDNQLSFSFDAKPISLWWPNKAGDQKLYTVCTEIYTHDGVLCQSAQKTVGFRSVKWVRNPDSPASALPYTMQINGKNIFLTGVNWVPYTPFYGAMEKGGYQKYLKRFRDMNCNIIRVWGGAILEKEAFYEVCDQYGLLVWQEFHQSSSGIDNCPSSDPALLQKLERISARCIRARRSHASHAIWCGGNELMYANGTPVNDTHVNIQMLQKLVEQLDPDACFLPCSASGPTFCAAQEEFGQGIHHENHGPWNYLGPKAQYEYYNQDDSLLRSESGTPAVNRLETLEKVKGDFELWPPDLSNFFWLHHGAWWIPRPLMTEFFGEWSDTQQDLETFIALSQYIQFESLRYAASSMLRRWPNASGYLIWAGNEPYPNSCNCNVVEQDGTPKRGYYALQSIYAPISVHARYDKLYYTQGETFRLTVCLSQHTDTPRTGKVCCTLYSLDGKVLAEQSKLAPALFGTQDLFEVSMTVPSVTANVFLARLVFTQEEQEICSQEYLFAIGTDLAPLSAMKSLPKACVTLERVPDGIKLVNAGDIAACSLYAYGTDPSAFLKVSPNCFHLLPGEQKICRTCHDDQTEIRVGGINLKTISC